MTFISLITLICIQIIRAWLPLLYAFAEQIGFENFAIFALGISCVPILSLFIKKRINCVFIVIYLALFRIVVQFFPMNFGVMSVGVVSILLFLPKLLEQINLRFDAMQLTQGIVMALALDTTLLLVFDTWDYIWQRSATALTNKLLFFGAKPHQRTPLL